MCPTSGHEPAGRRDITLLVTDMTGFTSFADLTEPEYAFETLAEYQDLVGTNVEQEGGRVLDLAGDVILAVFHSDIGPETSMRRGVRAALGIQRQSTDLIVRWSKRGQHLGMRIVLNAGFATVGHVRAGSYAKYAAIGSVVNVTFHLDRVARSGEILATGRVADAAAGLAEIVPRPDLELRGVARKVAVFALRAP